MAVELNIGDVVEVRLNFQDDQNTRAFNVLHYRLANVSVTGGGEFDGIGFDEVAAELAEVVFDNLSLIWADGAAQSVVFNGVTVTNVFPAPRSAQYTFNAAPPVQGAIVADALPLQDSPTILKKSAFGTRWGIGRVFFVGAAESMQAAGVLSEFGAGLVQAFANELAETVTFVEGPNTFFFGPVLYGPRPLEPENPRITQIVSIDLSDRVIKTQRRRRPGKGI